jgi:hypothetical protein
MTIILLFKPVLEIAVNKINQEKKYRDKNSKGESKMIRFSIFQYIWFYSTM